MRAESWWGTMEPRPEQGQEEAVLVVLSETRLGVPLTTPEGLLILG